MSEMFDNSATEAYINEYSKRAAEKTRKISIQNSRKEIPVYIAKGILVVLIIFSFGKAIQWANSGHSKQTITNINEPIPIITESGQDFSNDRIIDLEKILKEAEKTSKFENLINEKNLSNNSLRNYYIFDYIKLEKGLIEEVIVGRHFESVNSEPTLIYCYVDSLDSGFKKSFYLTIIDENGREVPEISKDMITSSNFSEEDLLYAQSKCGI